MHFGASPHAVVGHVQQYGCVLVEDPEGLAALEDEPAELVGQACRVEGRLAAVVVDVQHPALGTRRRRRLRLVDGDRDAVDVQDAGEREAAEAGADDRDVGAHGGSSGFVAAGEPGSGRWNVVP